MKDGLRARPPVSDVPLDDRFEAIEGMYQKPYPKGQRIEFELHLDRQLRDSHPTSYGLPFGNKIWIPKRKLPDDRFWDSIKIPEGEGYLERVLLVSLDQMPEVRGVTEQEAQKYLSQYEEQLRELGRLP